MKQPHVVIIMADQLRYDAIGIHTPHIRALFEEGVSFNRAYCASPLCVPARGAFFTGKYPNETGCVINPWDKREKAHGRVSSGTAHLYQQMEEEWDSWHTGKQHFLHEDAPDHQIDTKTHWLPLEGNYAQYLKDHQVRMPGGASFRGIVPEMAFGTTTRVKHYAVPTTGCFEPGFDYFFDGYITACSLEALQKRDRTKPFLLNAMYLAPHPPLDIPEPWFSRVESCDLPDNVGVWSKDQSPLQLYNLTGAVGTRYTREEWRNIWPVYLGLVSLLDDCVGMIVDELKQQGIYDDTLILFTSDHGEMLGSHGLWQKMCMYEESVRTPLCIKFPKSAGFGPGSFDSLVSSVDVFPTLCDVLGLALPGEVSGRSFMPIIRQECAEVREEAFIQFDGNGARGNFQRCMIKGAHKLIVDMFKDEIFLELYDVVHDQQEQTNLAFDSAYRPAVTEMLAQLTEHMARTGDLLTIPPHTYETFLDKYLPFHRS